MLVGLCVIREFFLQVDVQVETNGVQRVGLRPRLGSGADFLVAIIVFMAKSTLRPTPFCLLRP